MIRSFYRKEVEVGSYLGVYEVDVFSFWRFYVLGFKYRGMDNYKREFFVIGEVIEGF